MSEKINVMVTTENMEQMQMAAMIASVGAVSGNDVSVFLSMNALKYFMKGNDHKAPLEGEMGKTMLEKNVPPFLGGRQLLEKYNFGKSACWAASDHNKKH